MGKDRVYKTVTDINGLKHELPMHNIQAMMNDGTVIFDTPQGLRRICLDRTSHQEVNDFIMGS